MEIERSVFYFRVKKSQLNILGTRTDVVGKWSGKTNHKTKLKKLKWMENSFTNSRNQILELIFRKSLLQFLIHRC